MAGETLFWTNVSVAMASAAGIGAAIPLVGISKASPAVVEYSGADTLTNGDYILVECQGMVEVTERLFRVAALNAASNTFQLEGEDSTAYKTFVSGTVKKVTFDRSFTTLSEPSASGGEAVFEDTTTIHDAKDRQEVVSSTPETYSFVSRFAPGDPALIEANRAFITRTKRPLLITYANGAKYLILGSFAASLAPGASGRKVTTPITIAVANTGTSYAS